MIAKVQNQTDMQRKNMVLVNLYTVLDTKCRTIVPIKKPESMLGAQNKITNMAQINLVRVKSDSAVPQWPQKDDRFGHVA